MGSIIDWILDFLYDLASLVIGVLPDSPLQVDNYEQSLNAFEGIMGKINYFIPFGQLLIILSAYISGVLIWYGARWVLRLAKYID